MEVARASLVNRNGRRKSVGLFSKVIFSLCPVFFVVLFFERETSLEPEAPPRPISRMLLDPLSLRFRSASSPKGSGGVARASLVKRKTTAERLSFIERETRLELATPTLARLCSTN